MKFYLTSTASYNHYSKLEGREIINNYAARIGENFYDVKVEKDKDGDWVVDIGSIEELVEILEFIEQDAIVKTSYKGDYPTIEIYDDYRE